MIKLKHFFIYLFLVFIFVIILVSINYIRIIIGYELDKKDYKYNIDIVGNKDGYIPQGLAYSDKYNVILQTSYNSKHKVSKLYVIDFSTKKLIKELKILNKDKSENISHVGGVATDNETVWITSDYKVNEFSLEEIIDTSNDYISSYYEQELSIRGDFASVANNYLLIGDFFLYPFYKVPNNTPLMYFYELNSYVDYDSPKYIATLPIMVQGVTVTDNQRFAFTKSFTNLINSELVTYDNPLDYDTDETYELNNQEIPLYHFNSKNLLRIKKLPPMAEGLFYKDNKLYILFESSSDTYFYAYPKIDKLLELNTYKIDRN